jgi:hypothetical protein
MSTNIQNQNSPASNNQTPYYDAVVGAVIGYAAGGINSSHFQQAMDLAKQNKIPLSGINTAGNIVAAQFGMVAIISAALNNGVNGASNASFTTAIATLVGSAYGPDAGTFAGLAYGLLLDIISIKVRESNLGGQIYDFEQVLKDPEFWEIYNEHAEELDMYPTLLKSSHQVL